MIDAVSIRPPSVATLRKYGWSAEDWLRQWEDQDRVCPICKQPKTNLVIDHYHYDNYKKLSPKVRASFVRGIVCNWCNRRIVGRGATIERLENAAQYLRNYEERRKKLVENIR